MYIYIFYLINREFHFSKKNFEYFSKFFKKKMEILSKFNIFNNYSKNPEVIGPFYKVTFGKYKDKIALDVYEDKDYCFWLSENYSNNLNDLKKSIKIINNIYYED